MKTSSIAEAKAKLSSLVAHVKLGVEVVITERGRPVARLVPIQATEDEALRRMIAQGLVRAADNQAAYSGPRAQCPEPIFPDRDKHL